MSDRRKLRLRVSAMALCSGLLLWSLPAHAQNWRTFTSERQLWGSHPVTVEVEYAAGRLEVQPAQRSMLYRMSMRYNEDNVTPVSTFDDQSRTLRLGVQGTESRRRTGGHEGSRATIELTRELPLNLELEFGAGEAEIDLGGIRLQNLEVSTGASATKIRFDEPNPIRAERVEINAGAADLEVRGLGNTRAAQVNFNGGVGSTVLDFTGSWERGATASVKMGIGSLTLRFPRDLGVRIDRNSFLTSFEARGMTRREGSYFSSNWASARNRLTVSVDAALGSIEVDWVD